MSVLILVRDQQAHILNSLLDPSCSGSGIVNRLDYLVEPGEFIYLSKVFSQTWVAEQEADSAQDDRLNKLAAFQLMIIKHAMKCWLSTLDIKSIAEEFTPDIVPSVQRIVYSTCSIHAIEDEHVVRAALQSAEAFSASFKLASPSEVLPQWKRRGYPEEMDDPGVSNLAYTSLNLVDTSYRPCGICCTMLTG